jgi:tRNA(Ile)-lysidine synthetase-like protein
MEINVQTGSYVVAVSGGVDSMALLDLLARQPDLRLTVAHFDHGIRDDSDEDRKLVQAMAERYGLPFVYQRGDLGTKASEATARTARYKFLHEVRLASGAKAIITAHHQDDVLETALLNLLRGTGRKGLSSLKSTEVIERPLLQVSKNELLRYARQQGVQWREDSTNADDKYERNYVRLRLLPRYAEADRQEFLRLIRDTALLNAAIETQAANYLHLQPAPEVLDRHSFIMLPHSVAKEIMAKWLRVHTNAELSLSMLERLVRSAKIGRSSTRVDIDKDYWLEIGRRHLALKLRER